MPSHTAEVIVEQALKVKASDGPTDFTVPTLDHLDERHKCAVHNGVHSRKALSKGKGIGSDPLTTHGIRNL
jgi:hypothetical protein